MIMEEFQDPEICDDLLSFLQFLQPLHLTAAVEEPLVVSFLQLLRTKEISVFLEWMYEHVEMRHSIKIAESIGLLDFFEQSLPLFRTCKTLGLEDSQRFPLYQTFWEGFVQMKYDSFFHFLHRHVEEKVKQPLLDSIGMECQYQSFKKIQYVQRVGGIHVVSS